jgi:hypothetical protein
MFGRYVHCMDEARAILERLERIEALKTVDAGPAALLAELRALLREGEAWARAEGDGTAAARSMLSSLDDALGRRPNDCASREGVVASNGSV